MCETNNSFQITESYKNTTNEKYVLINNEIFIHPNVCPKGAA